MDRLPNKQSRQLQVEGSAIMLDRLMILEEVQIQDSEGNSQWGRQIQDHTHFPLGRATVLMANLGNLQHTTSHHMEQIHQQ